MSVIHKGFTGPITVNNHRPTTLFGVETEVGKSSARLTPNGQQVANFGTFTEGPTPWAAIHSSDPVMNQISESGFLGTAGDQPRGDVDGAR